MKDIKHIRQDIHPVPRGGTWGAGGSKNYFLNMVMWHIKLKGIISRPGYTEKNYPRIKLVILVGINMSNNIRFLRECGDLQWHAIKCVLVCLFFFANAIFYFIQRSEKQENIY